jgi:hypothetical protein
MDTSNHESDVQRLLADLESPQPQDRVYALRCLAEAPLADTRILAAAEILLADESLTVLSIPYTFGEVRWVAAAAVAALRGALHRSDEVRLADVPTPLTPDRLGALAEAVGLTDISGGIEGSLDAVARLRALGQLPRRNLVRMP